MRRNLLILLCLTLAPLTWAACDDTPSADGDGDAVTETGDGDIATTNPYLPDTAEDDGEVSDDTKEPIFVGKPCERDSDCTTGRCFGKATSQGFFEQPVCQDRCVVQQDFSLYCNSDADCCQGFCCVDCGFQKGLCMME